MDAFALHKKTVLTFSKETKKASMWQSVDGSLLWDAILPGASGPSEISDSVLTRILDETDIDADGIDDIAIVVGSKAYLLSGAKGDLVWQQQLPESFSTKVIKFRHNKLVFVGLETEARRAAYISLGIENGEQVDSGLQVIGGGAGVVDLENLSADTVCILRSDGEISYFNVNDAKETKVASDHKPYVGFATVGRDANLQGDNPGIVVLEFEGGYDLYHLNEKNEIEVFESYTTTSPRVKYGYGLMKSKQDEYFLLALKLKSEDSSSLSVDVFEVKSDAGVRKSKDLSFAAKQATYSYANHGPIDKVMPTLVEGRKGGQRKCRILFTTKGENNFMIQSDKELWSKDEATANIVNVVVVNRRDADDEISGEVEIDGSTIPSVGTRLQMQVDEILGIGNKFASTFKTLVSFARKFIQEKLQPTKAVNSGPKLLSKAESKFFGFYKVIVASTKCGKVVGLDSTTGATMWTIFFPELVDDNASSKVKVHVSRGETVGGKRPEVIATVQDSNSKNMVVHYIDASTGRITFTEKVNEAVRRVFVLPDKRQLGEKIMLLVNDDDKLTLLPSSTNGGMSNRDFVRNYEKLHFSMVDREKLHFGGYGISIDESTGRLKRYKLWSVQFPKHSVSTNKIVAVSTDQSTIGGLNSPVHILGDDSLMLKHLNPHLAAVALVSSEESEDSGTKKQTMTVSLIDTVTGRVVQRFFHKNCAGPVKITQSENWIFYSYWNLKARRTEISSIALYDGAIDAHALNPWTMLPKIVQNDNKALDTSFSSYDSEQPVILQKTFIFPNGITCLSGVYTVAGVTEKQLLIGTVSGQIYSLDRRFLDPRRPVGKPSKSDQTEGLAPYAPVLPMITQNVLSYSKEIERLDTILSFPAGLESTTLVTWAWP